MDEQAKVPFGSKHAENKPLHNFTIPKIKRDTEKVCFVHCTPNRREFSDIMDTVNKERLNMGFELKSSWNFSDLKLVINNDLEQNFFEKRMEMKDLGRHGRELEEKFCFLVVPNHVATAISKHGLSIGNITTKVLCGKVKKINSNSAMKVALDPTPNFDSHVSKKAPLWNDPLDEQVTNSLIYVYEYDSNFRPAKTPRHCLPIALVDATYIVQKPATSSGQVRLQPKLSSALRSLKMMSYSRRPQQFPLVSVKKRKPSVQWKQADSGNDSFASCTVAQRIGKGKDATIIYKSVRTKLLKPEKEISQKKCSEEKVQAPLVPDIDICSNIPVAPTAFQEHVTVPERSTFFQHNLITLENLLNSCMVTTSKSMKDPRLLKRCEQEAPMPADQYLTGQQTQNRPHCGNKVSSIKEKEASNENFLSCESIINETSLYLSFEERRLSGNFMNKEQLTKKLKKYSSFLSLNKKEREAKVQSLQRLSNEEKAVLSRKLCTYDKYYKMYANKLEIAKVGEKVKTALSTEKGPPTCSEAAVSVSMSACTTKSKENGHLQNNLFASATDSGQGEGSQYTPQDTNQKHKVLAKTNNNVKETCTDESSAHKNHAVDKTAVTGKPKAFKTDQSPESSAHKNHAVDKTAVTGKPKAFKTDQSPESSAHKNHAVDKTAVTGKPKAFKTDQSPESSAHKNHAVDKTAVTGKPKAFKTDQSPESSAHKNHAVDKTAVTGKPKAFKTDQSPESSAHKNHAVDKTAVTGKPKAFKTDQSPESSAHKNHAVDKTAVTGKPKAFKTDQSPESSAHKNHAVDKTAVTGKPKAFKTDQSPVTNVNSKRESHDTDKGIIYKAEAYPNSKRGPNDLKKAPNKMEKDFTAGIRASSVDLKATRIADPPLQNGNVNCQKGEEICILKKSPEKKIQKPSLHKGDTGKAMVLKKTPKTSTKQVTVIDTSSTNGDKSDTSSTKGAKSDKSSKGDTSLTKRLDTKTTNEKHSLVLHTSYEVDNGTTIKDICKTDSSLVDLPTQVSVCNTSSDADLVAKNICLHNTIQSLHSVELRGQKSTLANYTCFDGDTTADDLRCVIELENRIDWKSIFGMEMDQVNAMIADLHNPPLQREKEPSGMRIFPDMEITVVNCHYVCVDSCVSNLVGDMHPSMGAKEALNETFESFKTVFLNCHESDIQVAPVSVHDCKTSIEPNSEPVSSCIKVAEMIPSDDTLETKTDGKFASVKTLHTLNHPTMKRRLNNKRLPSILIKKSVQRINKFSQSEKNIKVVLGMLSDEIPLCKSKRISKKLSRAILHLRKAHKRVQKSLQIAAKAGERQNVPKTSNVQENENAKNRNVNNLKQSSERSEMKQVESSKCDRRSSQMIPTTISKSNVISYEGQQQKSLATNRQCLTDSTDVINGVSTKDSPLAKKDSTSAKQLAASTFKSNICSPETYEDHDISSVTISNKENAVPVISSPKMPTESKEICVESCETDDKDKKLHDAVTRRRYPVCTKRMFSQLRKQSSSHAKKLAKCSKRTSNSSSEGIQFTGQRKSIKEGATTKSVRMPSLLVKLSSILLKASKTCSLKSLQVCKLLCKQMLPVFIKSFEKKQQCVLKDVIVDRRLLFEQNLKTRFRCVLKPQAVEAFLELQMMMETDHFIENRMHYMEGMPTFRSLLWYDRSLYTELLKGESGYQQQSHFYTAFQNKLKLDASATLEKYFAQLSEFLNAIHAQNSCYYVYLKYNRELKECEDVLKHGCDHSEFSLSVPFSCGVHLGDTVDDLAALQKSTLEIITTFLNLPKCDSGKKEHALCLLEIISAKIDFIKTSVTTCLQVSLFGIEHLLFDAAKMMFFRERTKYSGQRKLTVAKESTAQKNSFALSKLHEVYCIPNEKTTFTEKQEDLWDGSADSNGSLGISQSQDVFFVGKIIDQARSANPRLLKQMTQDCKQQLEFQIKCFQLLQECDVSEVLIRESNILEITEKQYLLPTLLKTEAIEAYIELVMAYETLHFLNCIMSSQKCQKRSRGLLWYDTSLLSDLLHNQRLVSFLQEDVTPNVIDIIDSTISEIKSELDVICDCTNSVNFSYAFQIMTRELSELSELKNFVLKSKSRVSTYIHFSPYSATLHFGNSSAELDYNYKQLSDYLDILISTPKKDLGKMAHTIKIMKTIELTKVFVLKADQSAIDLFTCQILQNRKKHDQDKAKKMQQKGLVNDQSPRKRICTGTSAESTTSFTPKKQKVIKSSGKPHEKKRDETRVKSNLRAKLPTGFSTTVLQRTDQSPVKKSHTKDSTQKERKKLVFSSQKSKRQEYVKDIVTASKISKRSENDSKSNASSPQGFINRSESSSSLAKSPEASVSPDTHSKDQVVADSTHIVSTCDESIISTVPDLENISEPPDAHANKLKEESLRNKDTIPTQPSSNDSVTSMDECSIDMNTSEEPKYHDQGNPITEVEEGKQGSNSQTEQVPHKPPEWNSQPMPPMSSPFPQYPGSANPWQYSLYLWYQNTSNASLMAQGFQGVSYNTQQANPYNQASAFPPVLQNSYATSQQYANYPSQMPTQMYPPSGPFGAAMSYSYTDQSSASKQNSVPNSYAYSSGVSSGWPWHSWQ
ncbi:testis-expressed protein 15 isoform X3 [Pseudophryne corroboree]|uniref:testis-expressed protein 15 isoform X3 n=1 Tax=Pseudophryne corroboree TaxID=495146 RepID=UPI003081324D